MSGPLSSFLKRYEEVDESHTFNRKYFSYNVSRFINRTRVFQKAYPRVPYVLLATSGVFFWQYIQAKRGGVHSNQEINFRKQQLVQPVYELSAAESVDFPWSEQNLNEWLYRPVKISGRPIHAKAKLVPRYQYG